VSVGGSSLKKYHHNACRSPHMASRSSRRKKYSKEERTPTQWSEWAWNEERRCYGRYRLDKYGEVFRVFFVFGVGLLTFHKENMSTNMGHRKRMNLPQHRVTKTLEVRKLLAMRHHMSSRAKPPLAHPLSPLTTPPVPSMMLRQLLET
jgi:hypothetical protein